MNKTTRESVPPVNTGTTVPIPSALVLSDAEMRIVLLRRLVNMYFPDDLHLAFAERVNGLLTLFGALAAKMYVVRGHRSAVKLKSTQPRLVKVIRCVCLSQIRPLQLLSRPLIRLVRPLHWLLTPAYFMATAVLIDLCLDLGIAFSERFMGFEHSSSEKAPANMMSAVDARYEKNRSTKPHPAHNMDGLEKPGTHVQTPVTWSPSRGMMGSTYKQHSPARGLLALTDLSE